jgi:hypothetical protein
MGRKWRVLGMKVRLGVGGVAVTKRRDVSDAETFIIKESEVSVLRWNVFAKLFIFIQEACKEDQLDLEGKCMRKKKDKRFFCGGGLRRPKKRMK